MAESALNPQGFRTEDAPDMDVGRTDQAPTRLGDRETGETSCCPCCAKGVCSSAGLVTIKGTVTVAFVSGIHQTGGKLGLLQ